MADSDDAGLIDQIYEAAFITENWSSVLDLMVKALGGTDIAMFVTDGHSVPQVCANQSMQEAAQVFLAENWMVRNELGLRAIERGEPAFLFDTDIISLDDRSNTQIYPGYLLPYDLTYGLGTIITGSTDDTIVVSMHRGRVHGPFERAALDRANRFRPHLARAGLIATRLKLERLGAALAALEAVGLPAAALRETGRLLHANAGFHAVLPDLAQDRRNRLSLIEPGADGVLAAAIARGVYCPSGSPGCSIPIPAAETRPPMVLHLVPVAGETRDIFQGSAWILVAAPVMRVQPAPTALLEGLFDLTAAEARVVRGLMSGDTLARIAALYSVSHTTVRSQLQAVFAKTGTNRQADLIALLGGIRVKL